MLRRAFQHERARRRRGPRGARGRRAAARRRRARDGDRPIPAAGWPHRQLRDPDGGCRPYPRRHRRARPARLVPALSRAVRADGARRRAEATLHERRRVPVERGARALPDRWRAAVLADQQPALASRRARPARRRAALLRQADPRPRGAAPHARAHRWRERRGAARSLWRTASRDRERAGSVHVLAHFATPRRAERARAAALDVEHLAGPADPLLGWGRHAGDVRADRYGPVRARRGLSLRRRAARLAPRCDRPRRSRARPSARSHRLPPPARARAFNPARCPIRPRSMPS